MDAVQGMSRKQALTWAADSCQIGKLVASGVLQGDQALVLPQAFAEVFGGLRVEFVVAEAANEP